jgi:hypothetical protein
VTILQDNNILFKVVLNSGGIKERDFFCKIVYSPIGYAVDSEKSSIFANNILFLIP